MSADRNYVTIHWLNRCFGSCNTLDRLSSRVGVPGEAKDLNLHAFNMITKMNESKSLTKHISFKCDSNFTIKKCNSNQ